MFWVWKSLHFLCGLELKLYQMLLGTIKALETLVWHDRQNREIYQQTYICNIDFYKTFHYLQVVKRLGRKRLSSETSATHQRRRISIFVPDLMNHAL